jgi:transposase-like zinc ribbon protein
MNLMDVNREFRTEEDCLADLERVRWPDGVRCPTCGCKDVNHPSENLLELRPLYPWSLLHAFMIAQLKKQGTHSNATLYGPRSLVFNRT